MGKIVFRNLGISHKIKELKKTKKNLDTIFFLEGVEYQSVLYIFCKDEYLTKLNIDFLKHDTLTDIITFNFAPDNNLIKAEIYISLERVKENSLTYNVNYYHELYRVMIHGILHLCGFNDKTKSQKEKMTRKENEYLTHFKF